MFGAGGPASGPSGLGPPGSVGTVGRSSFVDNQFPSPPVGSNSGPAVSVGAAVAWRVRAAGAVANGGGYVANLGGADLTDQDAAQLSITDGATTAAGSTVLNSAAAGFTAAMVGNCIRISAGTNFQTGYYFITVVLSPSSVILDRTPTSGGAGSGGTGSIGGAFSRINNLANGGSGSQPAVATPLAAGHKVYVRGGGSDNPSVVDYAQDGYLQFPAGDTTNGLIQFIGYNGRPFFTSSYPNLVLYQLSGWQVSNCKFKITGASANGAVAGDGINVLSVSSCIIDQNGFDTPGVQNCSVLSGNYFMNSGSAAAGTLDAATFIGFNPYIVGNLFDSWKGICIHTSEMGTIASNIIANCALSAIVLEQGNASYRTYVIGNTIYNAGQDGIKIITANGLLTSCLTNNIIANCGGYGINATVGNTALNDRTFSLAPDYNDIFNCTSGAYNNMSAGPHDLAIDPQFTNAAGGDFSVATNLKAKGFPSTFLNALTTSYVDTGAAQRQETSLAANPLAGFVR